MTTQKYTPSQLPSVTMMFGEANVTFGADHRIIINDEEVPIPSQHLLNPFDVTEAPENFYDPSANNAPAQSLLLGTGSRRPDDDDHRESFFNKRQSTMRLSAFKRMYESGNSSAAMQLLSTRTKIELTEQEIENPCNPNIHWNYGTSYLDLLVVVGKDIGLAAMLPNVETHHTYEFTLDLKYTYRRFNCKNVQLGFDPTGSMVWIGRSHSGEDAWLAWAPNSFFDDDVFFPPRTSNTGPTTILNKTQRRRVVMFLANMLRRMPNSNESTFVTYPNVDNDDEFYYATNIHDKKIHLNVAKMRLLHRIIQEHYQDWLDDMPDEWKEDNFFPSRRPVAVTSRYGQNHPIGVNIGQEGNSWEVDRNWAEIRYMSVAIATHARVGPIAGYTYLNAAEIMEGHENVYDDWNEDNRQVVTLNELEQMEYRTEDNRLVHIYDEEGYPIQRVLAKYYEDQEFNGLLMEVDQLKLLYNDTYVASRPEYEDEDYVPPVQTELHFFPQSSLCTAGHYQANDLMPTVRNLMNEINRTIPREDMEETPRVIRGQSSQGYNAAMHAIRGNSAQWHDAQKGLITRAAGGELASNDKDATTAHKVKRHCTHRLPHQEFQVKLTNPGICKDFRFENVYTIDIQRLDKENQSGKFIFEEILYRLAGIMNHGSLYDMMMDSLIVFKPEMYPACYQWTSYGITSLLELCWKNIEGAFENNAEQFSGLVEVISVAERVLNFQHTGNAAVIATSVMYPMWVGYSLIQDGLPCFNPKIFTIEKGKTIHVHFQYWPRMKGYGTRPASSAIRSLELNYSCLLKNTFESYLSLAMITEQQHGLELHHRAYDWKLARALCTFFLETLIVDIKSFISETVALSIKRQEVNPKTAAHGKARSTALKAWMNRDDIFCYNSSSKNLTGNLQDLFLLLDEDPKDDSKGLQTVAEPVSHAEVVAALVAGIEKGKAVAPVVRHRLVETSFKRLVHHLKELYPFLSPEGTPGGFMKWVKDLLTDHLARHASVSILPWHKPVVDGRSSRAVNAFYWVKVHSPRQKRKMIEEDNSDTVNRSVARAHKRAKAFADDDPYSVWEIEQKKGNMGVKWTKKQLPTNWDLKLASLGSTCSAGGGYLVETYQWVNDNINLSQPLHHLAFIVAILFTTLLPNIFIDAQKKDALKGITNAERLTESIRELQFVSKDGRGGVREPGPYYVMLTTTIIAILEEDSPLGNRLYSNGRGKDKGSFGSVWNRKHGAKEITPLNLIRMKLAVAKNPGILSSPSFGSNWEMEPEETLLRRYNRLIGYLTSPNKGVYSALVYMFGTNAAQLAVVNKHVTDPTLGLGGSRGSVRFSDTR